MQEPFLCFLSQSRIWYLTQPNPAFQQAGFKLTGLGLILSSLHMLYSDNKMPLI